MTARFVRIAARYYFSGNRVSHCPVRRRVAVSANSMPTECSGTAAKRNPTSRFPAKTASSDGGRHCHGVTVTTAATTTPCDGPTGSVERENGLTRRHGRDDWRVVPRLAGGRTPDFPGRERARTFGPGARDSPVLSSDWVLKVCDDCGDGRRSRASAPAAVAAWSGGNR